jgi:hypothetical protein
MKKFEREKKIFLILAIVGDLLVWLPILAPILLTIFAYTRMQRFLFDYLMPAELFLSVLLGGILLAIVSFITRRRLKLILASMIGMYLLLVVGQWIAVATGLASGETQPGGWEWVLALGCIIGYDLLVATLGIAGVLLIRDLKHAERSSDD